MELHERLSNHQELRERVAQAQRVGHAPVIAVERARAGPRDVGQGRDAGLDRRDRGERAALELLVDLPTHQAVNDEYLVLAQAQQERGAHARDHHAVLVVLVDDGDRVGAVQLLHAAPHRFQQAHAGELVRVDEMRDHFRTLHAASDVAFSTEKLDYSFRSAVGVLDAVDAVFKQPAAFRGLTADPTWTVHQALPDAVPSAKAVPPLPISARPKRALPNNRGTRSIPHLCRLSDDLLTICNISAHRQQCRNGDIFRLRGDRHQAENRLFSRYWR